MSGAWRPIWPFSDWVGLKYFVLYRFGEAGRDFQRSIFGGGYGGIEEDEEVQWEEFAKYVGISV